MIDLDAIEARAAAISDRHRRLLDEAAATGSGRLVMGIKESLADEAWLIEAVRRLSARLAEAETLLRETPNMCWCNGDPRVACYCNDIAAFLRGGEDK